MLRLLPFFAVTLLSSWTLLAADHLRIYSAPEGEKLSARYAVAIDSQPVPVYAAAISSLDPDARRKLNGPSPSTDTAFASFDMRAPVEVIVTCPEPVRDAVVLPSSRGIHPGIDGRKISFTVPEPGPLLIEVNGDWKHSLQVFANPWEESAPDPQDPNVIYFGPGLHEVQSVEVSSGKTVYIAGGAVVYSRSIEGDKGPVFLLKGDHITLRGRGIIDGSRCAYHTRNMIVVQGQDIRVEGVVLRDSSTWNMPILKSDRVRVENLKIFGYRGNSDGIDINNSRQVDVGGCYLRTLDDLVVVKTGAKDGGESADILVHDCVMWNEFAHALSLGAELREKVERVRFSNCDVVRDKGREWLLRVYHCDAAPVRDITFDHIRVEEGRRLMSVWIGGAIWSKDAERGHVDGVRFSDITAQASGTFVDLSGFDAAHAISNVTFENVQVNGRPLKIGDMHPNAFVHGVTISP